MENILTIFTIIIGVYEVIVRAIPTVSNLSILSKVIELIKFLSSIFPFPNIKKSDAGFSVHK